MFLYANVVLRFKKYRIVRMCEFVFFFFFFWPHIPNAARACKTRSVFEKTKNIYRNMRTGNRIQTGRDWNKNSSGQYGRVAIVFSNEIPNWFFSAPLGSYIHTICLEPTKQHATFSIIVYTINVLYKILFSQHYYF